VRGIAGMREGNGRGVRGMAGGVKGIAGGGKGIAGMREGEWRLIC